MKTYDELLAERDALLKELHKAISTIIDLQRIPPRFSEEYLAQIRAEVGEIGYYNGFKDALVIEPPLPPATGAPTTIDIFAYRVEQTSRYAASQYAAKVRQGGE